MHPSVVLILFILLPVDARRIIRAAPELDRTGDYIVKLEDSTSHEKFEQLANEILSASEDGQLHEKVEGVSNIITARLSDEALQKIKKLDNVEYIEEETYAKADQVAAPWHLDRIDQRFKKLNGQYNNNYTGAGVDIYIIDTGIYYNHSEFEGRALYPGYDPMDAYESTTWRGADCDGHGTHVASLAAGKTYGVAKKARVYSVRTLNCIGIAPWSVVIDGINFATRRASESNRSSIISMSLSGGIVSVVDAVVRRVVNEFGIPMVVSAGNYRSSACEWSPANTQETITVGATEKDDHFYEYSNGGRCVDISAPGDKITGASIECSNCTDVFSGTSSSTALVSGVVATILEREPSLTPAEIRQHLIDVSSKNLINFNLSPSNIKENTPNRLLFTGGSINNVWPDGTYSLPMSIHECPFSHTDFEWEAGYIYQDNEDFNNDNFCTKKIRKRLSIKCKKDLTIDYCSKTEMLGDRGVQWPNGSYCIAKKGVCPEGFDSGSVYWDDENYRNTNYISGTVPDGEYTENTRIDYCCRNDGHPNRAMMLPSDKSFVLIRNHKLCQEVVDMKADRLLLTTDDENDAGDGNRVTGSYPHEAGRRNNSIRYCYYTPSH